MAAKPGNKVIITCAITGSVHGEHVAKIRRLVEEVGYQIATPQAPCAMFELKGADRVKF
jgi:uncharacterized protein (DUF849 family)